MFFLQFVSSFILTSESPVVIMTYEFPVVQCPKLDTLNCQILKLRFPGTLESARQSLIPIIHDLRDKQLVKCYLIPEQLPIPKYSSVLLGGTFDYLHIGHQLLLLTAILQASTRLLVGVTGEQLLLKKKNKQIIQPFHIRKTEIENYIKMVKPCLEVEVEEINDPFGPAIVREDFDAIAVSIETISGAHKINEIRKERKLKELQVEICPLMSENNLIQAKMSSGDIREYILRKNKLNIEDFIEYRQYWKSLNTQLHSYLKTQPNPTHEQSWWNRLLTEYSQYWRYYHTNRHILTLLRQLQQQAPSYKLSQGQLLAVTIGVWFHDVHYVPSCKQNEEISGKVVEEFFQGVGDGLGEEKRLLRGLAVDAVVATKGHQADRLYEQVLIDLDMGILDADQQTYDQYARQIREEYKGLLKEEYPKKRSQFLKTLDTTKIFYHHKPTNISSNISRQLKLLQQQSQSAQL